MKLLLLAAILTGWPMERYGPFPSTINDWDSLRCENGVCSGDYNFLGEKQFQFVYIDKGIYDKLMSNKKTNGIWYNSPRGHVLLPK